MLPIISTLTVTFGRVRWLECALYGLLNQDCPVEWECVLVNTFPSQRLIFEHPRVKIVNLNKRPASLGEARNIGVAAASGKIIRVADDDDYTLKGDLKFFADAFVENPDVDWVLCGNQFYAEGDIIKAVTPGACHQFAYTKRAWEAVGGYPPLSCGEDRVLVNGITKAFMGVKITPEMPQQVYCWANQIYHASGLGPDKPGSATVYDRVGRDLEQRVRCHQEPTGVITLRPKLRLDYEKLARDFMAAKKASEPDPEATCIVLLGCYGDIINALPIAKHIADTEGKPPHFMVSRQYADILDGVSYVIPFPVPLVFHQLTEAMALAKARFGRIVQAQIYGRNYRQEHHTGSFSMESWRAAGVLEHYHDLEWKLVFDKRDAARESMWAAKLYHTHKPKILTNLTSAVTSPFSGGREVLAALTRAFGQTHEVVDIGALRLRRVYDIIGLIDRAAVFITIDTATLHLAAASDTPLVALRMRNAPHWLNAEPRYGCVAALSYGQATPTAMIEIVNQALGLPIKLAISHARATVKPLVFHHSGDFGDIIYGLSAIRAKGGGRLFISRDCDVAYPPRLVKARNTVPLILPLLAIQSYLKGVSYVARMPSCVNFDLNNMRRPYIPNLNLAKAQQNVCGVIWVDDQPWLEVDRVLTPPGRTICITRSPRYHDDDFPWKALVQEWGGLMFFVGTPSEHAAFCAAFGAIPHVRTATLLDVARLVAGAKVCVGNQSAPIAIAHGLCKPVVQECFRNDRNYPGKSDLNCIFNRPYTLYSDRDEIEIPKEWLL